jgi:hypothetical protein
MENNKERKRKKTWRIDYDPARDFNSDGKVRECVSMIK